MSEQMPSPNISYYLDVRRPIPLIYLRFQKIPSLVFAASFVVGIIPVTVFSVFKFSVDFICLFCD